MKTIVFYRFYAISYDNLAIFPKYSIVIHKNISFWDNQNYGMWRSYPPKNGGGFGVVNRLSPGFMKLFIRKYYFLSTFFRFAVWTTPFYPHFGWIIELKRLFWVCKVLFFEENIHGSTFLDKLYLWKSFAVFHRLKIYPQSYKMKEKPS